MRRLRQGLLVAAIVALALHPWWGSARPGMAKAAQGQPARPLRIATKALPPFVFIDSEGAVTGFSIQLWEEIARRTDLDYIFYVVESVADQIAAVERGEADLAIAGITITAERESRIDFSQPYFDSGLQIVARVGAKAPVQDLIAAIFSPALLQFLLFFLGLILVVAHLVWFTERKRGSFSPRYLLGISQALWWSTVTAIGYDDRQPRSIPGRAVALLWMFAAIFVIANLTATLSASATVRELRSDIASVADLRGHRVVTLANTTSSRYLDRLGIPYTSAASIEAAFDALQKRAAEAIVYDAPVLIYRLAMLRSDELELVGDTFEPEKYGIALPTGSPLRETIDRALLSMFDDGAYRDLYGRWFSLNRDQ